MEEPERHRKKGPLGSHGQLNWPRKMVKCGGWTINGHQTWSGWWFGIRLTSFSMSTALQRLLSAQNSWAGRDEHIPLIPRWRWIWTVKIGKLSRWTARRSFLLGFSANEGIQYYTRVSFGGHLIGGRDYNHIWHLQYNPISTRVVLSPRVHLSTFSSRSRSLRSTMLSLPHCIAALNLSIWSIAFE